MKKNSLFYLFIFFILATTAGCSNDTEDNKPADEGDNNQPKVAQFEECDVIPGKLIVKLSPETADNIVMTRSNDGTVATGIPSIDLVTTRVSAVDMKPVFDVGGRFEKRQRAAGLHLWYVVTFDENVMVTRAAPQFGDIGEIDYVEPVYPRQPYGISSTATVGDPYHYNTPKPAAISNFNDPQLSKQWHYYNDGSLDPAFTAGADINLFKAWEIETGKPEVIVAVMDGGVDATHEDLAQNMWKDSEGRSGYNFYRNTYTIDADTHGTHVAGTIGAVNNNGRGLCGIAGGNGSASTGVRIMTCQIGPNDNSYNWATDENIARAYQYAADNGAVISNNSWGGGGSSTAITTGINYFIENAGTDGNGNQTGPMKGGLVIVAAGNDNQNVGSFPALLSQVISVAAIGPDFSKAWYSTYHETVDISAPGGDNRVGANEEVGLIWSTEPGNNYEANGGTSMACPHISGVAALIVSHRAGQGLTAEQVKETLLSSVRPIDPYVAAGYRGKMGRGYIDTYMALADLKAPDKVEYESTWGPVTITLDCTVPADADNGKPELLEVFYSVRSFTDQDIINPPSRIKKTTVSLADKNVGDKVSVKLDMLNSRNPYYIGICTVDEDRNRSEVAFETDTTGEFFIVIGENFSVDMTVPYPDGTWELELNRPGDTASASLVRKDDQTITFSIDGSKATLGKYSCTYRTRYNGTWSSHNLDYYISNNTAPTLAKEFDNIYTFESLDTSYTFDLTEHFSDNDSGDVLTFSAEVDNPALLVTPHITGDILVLKPAAEGTANVTITATDKGNLTAKASFQTRYSSTTPPPTPTPDTGVNLYPNPMVDEMNVLIGVEAKTTVKVELYNSIGSRVLSTTVEASETEAGRVNVSKLSTGYYTAVISYNGTSGKQKYTRTILKK